MLIAVALAASHWSGVPVNFSFGPDLGQLVGLASPSLLCSLPRLSPGLRYFAFFFKKKKKRARKNSTPPSLSSSRAAPLPCTLHGGRERAREGERGKKKNNKREPRRRGGEKHEVLTPPCQGPRRPDCRLPRLQPRAAAARAPPAARAGEASPSLCKARSGAASGGRRAPGRAPPASPLLPPPPPPPPPPPAEDLPEPEVAGSARTEASERASKEGPGRASEHIGVSRGREGGRGGRGQGGGL
ncbi:basic proline-rich protein-like [Cebus imitator]|uniref:basic proline-rich protein-like n=1 Tax=Cebus imitator TaxID=2715852 RepID=UPI00189A5451|nr:basic proline-rich protein-like [Cebus imitator]